MEANEGDDLKTGDLYSGRTVVDFLFTELLLFRDAVSEFLNDKSNQCERFFGYARASHLLGKGRGIRCLRFRLDPE